MLKNIFCAIIFKKGMVIMSLQLTKTEKQLLNQEFEGTEWCPHCNRETDFKYNPMKNKYITCTNCGMKIHPCSLCDGNDCNNCEDEIKTSLLQWT